MDFTPTERQRAAAEAYANTAELQELPLPAELGGAGLTVTELGALLTEAGRHADASVAPLMTAALPLARWGDRTLLAKRPRLAAAIHSAAKLDGDLVSGVVTSAEADYILVPAGEAVAVVDTSAPGVTVDGTTIRLDRAPVTSLFPGTEPVEELGQLTTLAACCLIDGALAGALDLTARHVASRRQFGRPLATFQAVAQTIADVAIASRCLHLVTVSACWRFETAREPEEEIELAGYWAAEGSRRVVMKCHHLHGGIGMDTTYPLHRFSSLVADQVRALGGAEYRLERLACSST
jgi:alkylation response protein AidB-like acyl-CoA dehydrogenase